jgi:hypothetical protein
MIGELIDSIYLLGISRAPRKPAYMGRDYNGSQIFNKKLAIQITQFQSFVTVRAIS